jgi:uncharacterized zinc-type alcohol dehydrogenase-like protein
MIKAFAVENAQAEFTPITYTMPAIGAHQVDIDVAYCGVCHSDMSMKNNEWGMTQYPFVGGHEVAGTVKAVGEHVTHLHVGQAVGLGWHSDYCHQCHSCDTGDQNLCASAEGTIIGRHGGFAQVVRADATAVIALPAGMDMKIAGPLFCGGITVFNPLVQFGIKPTDKVAVVGIGGLGHMALQFLRAWGCEVTAFSSSDSKAQEAYCLGAHHVINSTIQTELQAAAGSFDFIISTVNVSLDWSAYLATLKPKGRLHFVGATLEPLKVGVFDLLGGQKSISSSPVGAPNVIKEMLDFAVLHEIKQQIEVFPMSQINAAFEHMEQGKARYRIVLENDWE